MSDQTYATTCPAETPAIEAQQILLDLAIITGQLPVEDQQFLKTYLELDESAHSGLERNKARYIAHKVSCLMGVAKTCNRCGITKPASDFPWRSFVNGSCASCETRGEGEKRRGYERKLGVLLNNWSGDPSIFRTHGEANTYKNHGCRCDVCREANREYNRECRKRIRERGHAD